MEMRILKRLIPVLLVALSACAVPPPAPVPALLPADVASMPLVREQVDPPQPLLEHPGQPPANGYVWIAGRWNLADGRYHWQPGNWAAPRPGHVWQPHVWRLAGDRWLQEGGRWEPDGNGSARLRRH